MTYFTYLTVLLQELSLKLDDAFLFELIKFLQGLHSASDTPPADSTVPMLEDTGASGSGHRRGSKASSAKRRRSSNTAAAASASSSAAASSAGAAASAGPYSNDAALQPAQQQAAQRPLGHKAGDATREALFDTPVMSPRVPMPTTTGSADKMYFDKLHIQPVRLNITFYMGNSELIRSMLGDDGILGYLSAVIEALGTIIANVDDARLDLNQLLVHHVYESSDALTGTLVTHYKTQAMRELYQLLGSTQILGNPAGLIRSMGSNITSLFYEPAMVYVTLTPASSCHLTAHVCLCHNHATPQGAMESPSAFGRGLAKGGKGLVSTTGKVAGTAGKAVGAIGKGITKLDNLIELKVCDAAGCLFAVAVPLSSDNACFLDGVGRLMQGPIGGSVPEKHERLLSARTKAG